MSRVLTEGERVQNKQSPGAVHDLRVALRRCRSMADGLMELDGHPGWVRMKKIGGRLFDSLGTLRDVQVMLGWLEKLAGKNDSVRAALAAKLSHEERAAAEEAQQALKHFDRKQWKKWMRILPARARCVPLGGLALQHLALLRYQEAHELHRHALKRRSRVAWHELRLGVKRFRYCVENFLPARHAAWGDDLKRAQDLLGEVHDLDVLQDSLRHAGAALTAEARGHWREVIGAERSQRLEEYKRHVSGRDSWWSMWRAGLPDGRDLENAALAWFRAWAGFRDEDGAQRQRVVRLSLQLFDGCGAAAVNDVFKDARNRRLLQAAAVMQNAGRVEGVKGHHKRSYRMIRELPPPIGWTAGDMQRVALVARYHRGAEPREKHEGFAALAPAERTAVLWLAGTLRLADGLVACGPGPVTSVRVESSGAIHIWADGWKTDDSSTELLEAKKHLLEMVSRRPVMLHAEAPAKALARAAG
jgi:exopolyphosphatase/guanosine-5'-triphosphate,3'-diphosphate pyrophosphatase